MTTATKKEWKYYNIFYLILSNTAFSSTDCALGGVHYPPDSVCTTVQHMRIYFSCLPGLRPRRLLAEKSKVQVRCREADSPM